MESSSKYPLISVYVYVHVIEITLTCQVTKSLSFTTFSLLSLVIPNKYHLIDTSWIRL